MFPAAALAPLIQTLRMYALRGLGLLWARARRAPPDWTPGPEMTAFAIAWIEERRAMIEALMRRLADGTHLPRPAAPPPIPTPAPEPPAPAEAEAARPTRADRPARFGTRPPPGDDPPAEPGRADLPRREDPPAPASPGEAIQRRIPGRRRFGAAARNHAARPTGTRIQRSRRRRTCERSPPTRAHFVTIS